MVFGLWIQRFGVGLRGDSGPKAPIVLGTNSFSLSDRFKGLCKCNLKVLKSDQFHVCFPAGKMGILHF